MPKTNVVTMELPDLRTRDTTVPMTARILVAMLLDNSESDEYLDAPLQIGVNDGQLNFTFADLSRDWPRRSPSNNVTKEAATVRLEVYLTDRNLVRVRGR